MTAAPPVDLGTVVATSNWNVAAPNNGLGAYGPIDGAHPPIVRTPGPTPAMTVRGAHAANWTTLNVSNPLPAYYQMPVTMTLTKGAANYAVTCTAKTLTLFQNCASVPAIPAGGLTLAAPAPTLTTAVNAVNSTTVTAAVTALVPAGAITTITVASTAAFSPTWFFVQTAAGAAAGVPQSLVQCTGYDNQNPLTPFFTGCTTNNGGGTPALTNGWTVTNNSLAQAQLGTIGGFLKIEQQLANGNWNDITMQILNYGIGDRNEDGVICADPSPNAILRIQRLRDNGGNVVGPPVLGGGCNYAGSTNAADYWPKALFDTREGLQRDVAPAGTNVILGGVMYFLEIDVANLSRWFTATAPFAGGTGINSRRDNGGFTVYFSDRRNNRRADNTESSEYGWEDFVNPASATGTPNNVLDTGEDVNASAVLDVYGGVQNFNGVANAVMPGVPAGSVFAAGNATPIASIKPGEAQVNRSVLFRHALKLVRGNNIRGLGVTGLTVVSENPVYVEGDWNSQNGGASDFNGANAGDGGHRRRRHAAVEQLERRCVVQQSVQSRRCAIAISPPGIVSRSSAARARRFRSRPGRRPTSEPTAARTTSCGSWKTATTPSTILARRRRSSTTGRRSAPTSAARRCTARRHETINFDINFNNPALLPPNTPVFRDMNSVGFSQELRPGR